MLIASYLWKDWISATNLFFNFQSSRTLYLVVLHWIVPSFDFLLVPVFLLFQNTIRGCNLEAFFENLKTTINQSFIAWNLNKGVKMFLSWIWIIFILKFWKYYFIRVFNRKYSKQHKNAVKKNFISKWTKSVLKSFSDTLLKIILVDFPFLRMYRIFKTPYLSMTFLKCSHLVIFAQVSWGYFFVCLLYVYYIISPSDC